MFFFLYKLAKRLICSSNSVQTAYHKFGRSNHFDFYGSESQVYIYTGVESGGTCASTKLIV